MVHQRLDATTMTLENETIVYLKGEIDLQTTGLLRAEVEAALETHPTRVVLDLSEIEFCDSTGLGTLVVLNRAVTRAKAVLILTGVRPFLRRLLIVTGTNDHFVIRDKDDA